MSSDVAIKVKNLSKCYQIYDKPRDRLLQMIMRGRKQYFREFWALRDLSFEIRKGETVGIIGRNGSGKSTLLQMICGTLNPSSGSISTHGRIAALLELGSGFNPEFTGRENVFMNAAVLGLTHEETVERFEQIVRFADIGNFIEQPVKTYSSGMMVRLAFSVIAHVDADILVVDEALAVGDAFFTQKCMRFLRGFMEHGTVLFVSHDTSAVVNLCTKAILLDHGTVVATGSPKDVAERYLAKLYESSQEIGGAAVHSAAPMSDETSVSGEFRDMRLDWINNSNLRNDIEVFRFEPGDDSGFGTGAAVISSVRLLDSLGRPLSWVIGGEDVTLEINCEAHQDVFRPIIGFQFKDRLGQVIFADNTYLSYEFATPHVESGRRVTAKFSFRLPVLPSGDYSIGVAIADGSQDNHVQHHWRHDAQIVRVHASSVCFGLIGLPMKDISLEVS